jgi:hypothetical protein
VLFSEIGPNVSPTKLQMLIPEQLIDRKTGTLKILVQCVSGLEEVNGKGVYTKDAADLAKAWGTVDWDSWGIIGSRMSVSSVYAGREQIVAGQEPF